MVDAEKQLTNSTMIKSSSSALWLAFVLVFVFLTTLFSSSYKTEARHVNNRACKTPMSRFTTCNFYLLLSRAG